MAWYLSQSSIRPGDDSDYYYHLVGEGISEGRNPVFALEMIQTWSSQPRRPSAANSRNPVFALEMIQTFIRSNFTFLDRISCRNPVFALEMIQTLILGTKQAKLLFIVAIQYSPWR